MIKLKLKCLFGYHVERWLGFEQPFYQQILMKCDNCGKYNLWHRGIMVETGWTKKIDKFPEVIKEYIIKNKL